MVEEEQYVEAHKIILKRKSTVYSLWERETEQEPSKHQTGTNLEIRCSSDLAFWNLAGRVLDSHPLVLSCPLSSLILSDSAIVSIVHGLAYILYFSFLQVHVDQCGTVFLLLWDSRTESSMSSGSLYCRRPQHLLCPSCPGRLGCLLGSHRAAIGH